MREMPRVNRVQVVQGQPWEDVIISLLEPRSPYRPLQPAGGSAPIEPGDAVVVTLDTDPVSVLAAVGIVGPDGDVHNAMAAIEPFYIDTLLELDPLNASADFHIPPSGGTIQGNSDDIVTALGEFRWPPLAARFGHNSLAAARTLLGARGRWGDHACSCTGCELPIDLTGADAREHVHIHTVSGEELDDDWPAVLCDSCRDRMESGGFTSFLDFRFSLHPPCPSCSAQRTMSAMFGMPAGPVEEPWIATMGCVVREPRSHWVCMRCRHEW